MICAIGAALVWFVFGTKSEPAINRQPMQVPNQIAESRSFQAATPSYQVTASYQPATPNYQAATASYPTATPSYPATPSYQPNPMPVRQAYPASNVGAEIQQPYKGRSIELPKQASQAFRSNSPGYQPNPYVQRQAVRTFQSTSPIYQSNPVTQRRPFAETNQGYPTAQVNYEAMESPRGQRSYAGNQEFESDFRLEFADEIEPRVRTASYESGVPQPNFSPARINEARSANWSEIEMAPAAASSNSSHLQQRTVLKRQRATPQVENRALEHVRYGQSLTRRRSYYAAREEFVRALLLVSSSYNRVANSTVYPERLAQALTAIDEADDFQFGQRDANYQQKILSHTSGLLSPQDIATIPPMNAVGLYSSFAQSQIEQAIGYSTAGSEALHALGKLESIAPEANRSGSTSQNRTLVFFRAAVNVNPSNSVCANDLGVLLFDMGQLQEAENALKVSIGSSPSQMAWNNLAAVHGQRAASTPPGKERDHQLWLSSVAAKEAQEFVNNPQNIRFVDSEWATASEFQENAAFPDTVMENVSGGIGNNPAQGPGAASLMQKVKGWF